MIEFIKGDIESITPASVVLENHGIGYFINISLNTFSEIQKSDNCKLYIYEAIREDAIVLYGFSKIDERNIFLQLLGVSGVGANTARMILSSMTVDELKTCIATGDQDALKSVKGIGLKTALRILVDLKDKVSKSDVQSVVSSPKSGNINQIRSEAIAALQMLGFPITQSQKAVAKIMTEQPGLSVEMVIKAALKIL